MKNNTKKLKIMKFIVSSSELYSYLQALNKVVPSRSILPIVENFLFDVNGSMLKITATDLETTLIGHMELANVEGTGRFAIESKRLLDIVKEFSEQPLTFNFDEEKREVVINTETGKYTIPVITPAEEYPEAAAINPDEANSFVIAPYVLLKGITSTIFSVADDELRPVMNGIFVELKPDYATFVSSDSHKLIRYRRHDIKSGADASFILPKRPAELIKSILPKVVDDIKVEFDNRNAHFNMTGFSVICRLIEGNYPDYEAVIPQNNNKRVEIDRNIFLNTIRRVSLFSNEASKLVKLSFDASQVEITAQDIDFSISAYEKIPCLYNDEAIKIGFKSTFVVEILQNIPGMDIALTISNPKLAALIFPAAKEDDNEDILTLIMPMVIDENEEN